MRVIKPPCAVSQWERFIPNVLDHIEPWFQNIREICADRNLSVPRVSAIIQQLTEKGLVERRLYRPAGSIKPIQYYRVIQDEKQNPGSKKHRCHR